MMRLLVVSALLALALVSPASAHKLRVFADIAGDTVSGYAFFIGGGRAQGTPWSATDAGGALIGSGQTDEDGAYAFSLGAEVSSEITITVNTEEGHVAQTVLTPAEATAPPPAGTAMDDPAAGASATGAGPDIAALVETATQRQIAPLREQIAEMDSRMRMTDIMSGLFLIVGLAGIGLWARGKRR